MPVRLQADDIAMSLYLKHDVRKLPAGVECEGRVGTYVFQS